MGGLTDSSRSASIDLKGLGAASEANAAHNSAALRQPAELGAAVDCRHISKSFASGHVVALHNVSLSIRINEFFTLLGPSGCGKTTLLRVIAGLEVQDSGSISVHGHRLDGLPPFKRPVNTVFQSYAVFPHLTVAQNIAFGLEMQRKQRALITARVKEMLALVRLEGLEKRKPAQLSGGQQQRVALARALATQPRVLLLDEPLSALDQKLRKGMQLELKRLQSEVGITFIFVTHDQHEALTMSDRIAVMNGGRILQIGTPEEIYEHPAARFVADFIGETNLLAATRIAAARYRLASGIEVDASEDAGSSEVTLAIRPERIKISKEVSGQLRGTVDQIIYEGTDTTYHLMLPDGSRLRVCMQNREDARKRFFRGENVSVLFPPDAIKVLTE